METVADHQLLDENSEKDNRWRENKTSGLQLRIEDIAKTSLLHVQHHQVTGKVSRPHYYMYNIIMLLVRHQLLSSSRLCKPGLGISNIIIDINYIDETFEISVSTMVFGELLSKEDVLTITLQPFLLILRYQ